MFYLKIFSFVVIYPKTFIVQQLGPDTTSDSHYTVVNNTEANPALRVLFLRKANSKQMRNLWLVLHGEFKGIMWWSRWLLSLGNQWRLTEKESLYLRVKCEESSRHVQIWQKNKSVICSLPCFPAREPEWSWYTSGQRVEWLEYSK